MRERNVDQRDQDQTDALTVAILAGGRGSRLGGVNKATLDLNGGPLIEHVLAAVSPLAHEILVVANDDRFANDLRLTLIRDPDPHAGVLPALLAALDAAATPLLLLVACDMPFVQPAVVMYLMALAADADAIVPHVARRDQPMHAIYRVAPCRVAVRAALARGDRRMTAFLADVRTHRVSEDELRAHDPDLRSFVNINTPADLAAARLGLPAS